MTIQEIFTDSQKSLLNIYFTAGYPALESLPVLLKSLEASGVDMVEIGIPYSDPLSDGPTIQHSSSVALANGITVDMIFEQLKATPTDIPKIMMGYFNTVLQYGPERFCQQCKETGVTGLILPDLPMNFYLAHYESMFSTYGLSNIFLITPETSTERIRLIDQHSSSFIYAVSKSGTTGKTRGIQDSEGYLNRLKELSLKHPIMVGFNISTSDDFAFAGEHARGGIIGSAFIKHIGKGKDLASDVAEFVSLIKS